LITPEDPTTLRTDKPLETRFTLPLTYFCHSGSTDAAKRLVFFIKKDDVTTGLAFVFYHSYMLNFLPAMSRAIFLRNINLPVWFTGKLR